MDSRMCVLRPFSTRLDRWYAPSTGDYHYETAKDYTYQGSDHDAVRLLIRHKDSVSRGPGTHRINTRILEEREIQQRIIKLEYDTYNETAG